MNNTILHEISKDDLKYILENHSVWINTDEKEGKQANLAGYNLRGIVLLGENLKKANFKGKFLN